MAFAADADTNTGQTPAPTPQTSSANPSANPEIEQLRQMILEQQRQISELQRALAGLKLADSKNGAEPTSAATKTPAGLTGGIGEVASTTPILPTLPAAAALATPIPLPQAPQPIQTDAVQKAIDAINANLRGFRFSGDLRFRTDLQFREANTDLPPSDPRAVPIQRARERYRVRLNLDKDLFFKEGADRALASFHLQLATDPFNVPTTQDADFSGLITRAPISINEAWMDFRPTRNLTLRAGRTTELYADNRQFIYDDDVRFNGFHETYRWTKNKSSLFVQIAAAQYILTDPNVQVAAANSIYVTQGLYAAGQRIPSTDLFDQGITVGSNIGKKWSHNETINYFAVREPNQIQLASSTGQGFVSNPAVGATLISNLGESGNATTTPGGSIYNAAAFHVVRGAFNLNYSGVTLMKHNYPFQLFIQGTHNTGSSIENNGYMAGWNFGQTSKLGDMQIQYQYFYKPANGFVSQFTDDDIGSGGTGVNLKGHEIRLNFGLTRFLAWENRLYIQNGIAINNPALNFFVPLQQGYNTQFRVHSQFVFTF